MKYLPVFFIALLAFCCMPAGSYAFVSSRNDAVTTVTEKKIKKKREVKRMGILGKVIRKVLRGELSKRLFEQYWTGQGNYYLSDREMITIAGEMQRLGAGYCTDSSFVKDNDSVVVQRRLINFYKSKDLANALGYATVYIHGNAVTGFYDDYDFNPKPLGIRGFIHEMKTRFMHIAGRLHGAKAFEILYGSVPGK